MSRLADHPVPARAALLLVVLAVVTAACGGRITGPREWLSTATLVAGGSHTIAVRDTSGLVDSVEIDPPDAGVVGGIANPAAKPNVVVVPWTGGACDRRTEIAIAANGPGLALTVRTTVAPGSCDAIGVGHVLRLTTLQPIPAAAVTFNPAP